jgi:hypothetical protein
VKPFNPGKMDVLITCAGQEVETRRLMLLAIAVTRRMGLDLTELGGKAPCAVKMKTEVKLPL